ncbi:RHS repeat-associated core domain-containing protein [Cystobacter fuscus]|uniref:RHS repeat-associated core domain-containing protein n=1 Tax=Cystobacter fuscus TaxID=43 RepID=UPI001E3F46C8|nr:RHS repeat-associated core domain-containing protein [Cystobacter fuscus]
MTSQGVVLDGYEYQRYQTGAQPFWTPLRFPGQYHDVETDLFENWNRYYDPSIGRYLQPEPMAVVDSLMVRSPTYGYAKSNPINWTDPTGNYTVDDPTKCSNWKAAEWLAQKWAGCAGTSGDKNCKCQEALAKCNGGCDICAILATGTGPEALFQDLGELKPTRTNDPSGYDGKRARESIHFVTGERSYSMNERMCNDSAYIPALASTLIHEASHACAIVNNGKGLRDRNTLPGMLDPPTAGCAAVDIEAACKGAF